MRASDVHTFLPLHDRHRLLQGGMLPGGSINAQLLVLPRVGLAVVRAGCPIGDNFGAEGLEVQFAFPCGAKDAFPVSFI